jgi:hypothetical protein
MRSHIVARKVAIIGNSRALSGCLPWPCSDARTVLPYTGSAAARRHTSASVVCLIPIRYDTTIDRKRLRAERTLMPTGGTSRHDLPRWHAAAEEARRMMNDAPVRRLS